jgi:hypothetical protein
MTEQMLAHGSYGSYLVYPPGFSTTAAVICRLSGLAPLSLFPVLAPALLLLTTLAAYVLASRLWGWEYGLAAAVLSGLVLIGPDVSFGGGLYPDLLAAFFLMVMLVAALVSLYQSPSVRSGLLVAVLGAAVVLFHSVGALYLVLLLAGLAVVCLPYLLLRAGAPGRALARALIAAVAGLGVLSVAYAWHIYGLGHLFSDGTTKATVGLDVGSQSVLPAGDILSWVGSPVIWLGVFGFAALAAASRFLRTLAPAQVLCVLTLLTWAAVMYLGSRTSVDGFPQRFERDVGAPLTILATLSVGVIVPSLAGLRLRLADRQGTGLRLRLADRQGTGLRLRLADRQGTGLRLRLADRQTLGLRLGLAGQQEPGLRLRESGHEGRGLRLRLSGPWGSGLLAAAAAAVVVIFAGTQAVSDMMADSQPSNEVTPPGVAAAGAWLGQHNTGGTIISTPDMNRGVTNRAILAMGGYTGLQSYPVDRIEHPRSLPTAGRQPLLDSRMVLLQPQTCRAARVLAADDVRYIILYRLGNQANFAAFAADPALYQPVFQNHSVVIYAARPAARLQAPAAGCGATSTTAQAGGGTAGS